MLASTTSPDLNAFERNLKNLIDVYCGFSDVDSRERNYLTHESFFVQMEMYRQLFIRGREAVKRGVELGCGSGITSLALSQLGYEMLAVDYYNYKAEKLARNVGSDLAFRFSPCDLERERIPAETARFDFVICIDAIEHTRNVKHLLEEASRVLRPKGYLYVSTPNYGRLQTRLRCLTGVVSPRWPIPLQPFVREGFWAGHVREFTLAELRLVLLGSGLKILRHISFNAATRERLANKDVESRGYGRLIRIGRAICSRASALLPGLRSEQAALCMKPSIEH